MGCGGSKQQVQEDPRRAKQAEKRKQSQQKLRPEEEAQQEALTNKFESEVNSWPYRPPWYLKGKFTQGANVMIALPEPLRGMYFTVVCRNDPKYTVSVGFGQETKFDSTLMRLSIACSTVSSNHCRLHFTHTKQRSIVEIEDCQSLNGTFLLSRPPAQSTRRPMLEMEVRGKTCSLEGVEYIRLGAGCVLTLESTNIYWDDEPDENEVNEEEVTPTEDMVPKMLEEGWYFPMPCPPKVAELTQKKREAPPTHDAINKVTTV
eukprot:c2844_g1_i1.p1 GENE.c2844_g1_i1~~c2844_g1_i1.p1  ORF type:complete len:261 (-),score=45.66 c2844_g1_i1:65-847(-)